MTLSVADNAVIRKKTATVCSKCKSALESRAHRSWFVKTFLFWLPIRKFKCYKCKRTQYVLINR
jgi:hypothetical protein